MNEQDNDRTADEGSASPRQRAIEAYDSARGRAVDTLGEAPLLALAGGIAAGALIAALLPRQAESRLIRPTAKRVKDSARAAFEAARDTGKKNFDDLGYTRAKGEESFQNFLQGLKDTARASADAAVEAVRNKG